MKEETLTFWIIIIISIVLFLIGLGLGSMLCTVPARAQTHQTLSQMGGMDSKWLHEKSAFANTR
jgi:hypothetical protein